MSHIEKLEAIFTDHSSGEFAVCAGPNSGVSVKDSKSPASWFGLPQGLERYRDHWRGPRCVNLAMVGPSFIADDAETSVGGATLKRILDLVGSLLILVLVSPILLCTALAVCLESAGPVLYRQIRVGRHGETFSIYKFRTMRVDAEEATGPQWAVLHDPRVTRIGGFLRRMRIDELPQLINVIKGEMSIVGPRPERPFFVQSLAKEIPSYAQRHHARPGITGWAQINCPYGASTEDAKEKLSYDLYYLKNSNFIFDLLILLSTPKAVLIGKGGR